MPRLSDLPGLRPNPDDPDRVLVSRFAAGDTSAFAALMGRHGPLVLGVCRRELGRSPLADEAFQATFLVLARKAHGLRNPDGLANWLFGVARRVARAARREETRQAKTVRESARVRPPQEKPRAAEWDELLRVVDEELERLPDEQRAAVLLCLYHGKTQDEAATALGWSLSTLRRRLEKGRELLKSRLTSRGATLGAGLLAGALAPSALAGVSPDLHGATLDLATGAAVGEAVPNAIESLAIQGVTMSATTRSILVVCAMILTGGAVLGFGWYVLRPIPAPPASPQPMAIVPNPSPSEPLRNPWVEPLPPRAAARLGTTAFRHGSGGAFGIVEPQGVTQLSFLSDGTLVSVGGGRVRFWHTADGRELHTDGPGISTRLKRVTWARVFDDGRKLLLSDSDENGNTISAATVWNLATQKALRQVKFGVHEGRKSTFITPSAVNRDGTRFLQVDGNGDAWVWDAEGKPLGQLADKVSADATQQFLSDGQTLLTVEAKGKRDEGSCRVWNTTTGAELRSSFGGPSRLWGSAVSANVETVATLGVDGEEGAERIDAEVQLWDVTKGEVTRRFPLDGFDRRDTKHGRLLFSPDGEHLMLVAHAPGGVLMDVRWWSLTGNTSGHWTAHAHGRQPFPVALSRQGQLLAVGTGQGSVVGVRLFDWATGREKLPPEGHATAVRSVEFSENEREIITTDLRGDQLVWDAATGRFLRSKPAPHPRAAVQSPSFPEGVDLYQVMGLRPAFGTAEARRAQPGGPDALITAQYPSADQKSLIVGVSVVPLTPTEAGRVYVIDVPTRKVHWQAPLGDAAPTSAAYSPDGSRVVVGTTIVTVFDVATGKPFATFDGHRGAVTALSFSKDGKRLVSGSADTTAVVWNLP